ncbi:MAG: cyclase family protein [Chloroflexia bacterium]
MTRFVDLSHGLHEGMPVYPGQPVPRIGVLLSHEESAERGTYAPGTTFQMATYELSGNTGTYVDSPYHRHPGGADLAGLALEKLADLPGVVFAALQEGEIKPEAFEGVGIKGKAVLIRTDWSKRWGGDYFRSGPYLGAAACNALIEGGVALVGIDCANIDNMGDPISGTRGDLTRPAHTMLLAAGIPIVEHLRGLDELPAAGFRFFAVPPAIVGGTSFAVRAFAILD